MGLIMGMIDEIIEQKLTRGEIMQAYQESQINGVERLLMFSLDNRAFFHSIMNGVGEYHLPYDSTVPRDAYFTNIPVLLHAFYSLYLKYPLYHFDHLLECGLLDMCSTRFELCTGLPILYNHLIFERDGQATFTIDAVPILKEAAVFLKDERFREMQKRNKAYEAASYEEGTLGLYKHYNELFVEAAGISILPEE